MRLITLSKNIYINFAFEKIYYDRGDWEGDVCIIDTSSYFNLYEIHNALINQELSDTSRIILLVSKDVLSQLLSSLDSVPLEASVSIISSFMKHGCQPKELLNRISSLRSLDFLTKQEIALVKVFHEQKSIKKTASKLNKENKTIYRKIDVITSKLNLNSSKQLLLFIGREFSNSSYCKYPGKTNHSLLEIFRHTDNVP